MLKVQNIAYYIKSHPILQDISFEAKPGELVAILGANGAGKSTLIKILSQEHKPAKGGVWWKHQPVSKIPLKNMATERAVLTQNIHMSHDFPVKEVVLMGRYPHFKNHPQPEDWKAVENTALKTGTQPFMERAYASLSGGEKQRVQLARALVQLHDTKQQSAKLLLLDEPLNNLDIRYQHSCLKLAKEFAQQGHVVLLVIHDINLAAMYADKVLLLHQGKLEGFGAPAEILTEPNLNKCYEFSVKVENHPYHHCPVVYFGHFPETSAIQAKKQVIV